MNRTRWPNCLATKTSRRHSTGVFSFVATSKTESTREIYDVEDLRASITAAIAAVITEMLQKTWLELDYRLDILRTTKGIHAEVH
ncbi:hypothetical protein AVEN_239584-1 [Araneus ventricosus]|uniref:Uncharacterized protein n=1 Tax=Araneus ventricosus TaxID=182803 RepID=A0A4Y2LVR4_ARAVE|nr:hypothetical protein AVEN_239584-1 [Araneus ventricosus]